MSVLKSGGLIKPPFTFEIVLARVEAAENANSRDPDRVQRPRRDQMRWVLLLSKAHRDTCNDSSGRDMQWRFASKRTDRSGR